MTTGVKNYAIGAVEAVHYARLDADTNIPQGQTGTIAAGSDESMLTYKGFATFTDTPATAEAVPIQGDAGNIGNMFTRALDSSTGVLAFNTADNTFKATAEDLSLYTDGDYEVVGVDDKKTVLNPLAIIINAHATSMEDASLDEQGWVILEILKTTAEKTDSGLSGTDFNAQAQQYNLIFDSITNDMSGRTITDGNYGRTELRGREYWSENPVQRHTLIGNAVVTTTVLEKTPAAEDGAKVRVTIDGVAKVYTTDYTVVASTKTLTYVAAPGADEEVVIDYEYLIAG